MEKLSAIAIALLGFAALANPASAQDSQSGGFQLSSTTFKNEGYMPLSAIYTLLVNGLNVCTVDGSPGGNESPELSWTNAPAGTASFAVTAFDVTAGFVHWGMYDISAAAAELPENAGVPKSSYGKQIVNNFGSAGSNAYMSYDGPCPPADYPPNVHNYVFTVYALDTNVQLPFTTDFPATAATLFRALEQAGESGHVLASASITGLYSNTPPSD